MVAAGVAWMVVVTSGLNVVVQASAPNWVKACALATYLLVFQGTLAARKYEPPARVQKCASVAPNGLTRPTS
jgi:hypothetical protein